MADQNPQPKPDLSAKPDDKPQVKQTEHLVLPDDTKPMGERRPSPGTMQLNKSWRLLLKIGQHTKRVALDDQLVIGRILENDQSPVDLDLGPYGAYHFGVSRRHSQITLHDGYLYIEDLGSTNGTRINGFQLTPRQKYRLRDGDEVEFARLRLTIRFERPDAP